MTKIGVYLKDVLREMNELPIGDSVIVLMRSLPMLLLTQQVVLLEMRYLILI